ncbi:ABC transporter permease [Oceanibacterium hippocampi]|nr:ABC transporter permease [Oceanibacterium hippocampi]
MFGLTVPALVMVTLFLGVPVAWLFGLSFYEDGQFTARHFTRMLEDSSYSRSLWLTVQISVAVTAFAMIVGYPVSYVLSQLPRRWAAIGLTFVVIPFWTSLLVRTYAWLILLQRKGVVNDALMSIGIIDEPLYLVHNVTGTIIGMSHIMLPFLILPLYANMKRIDLSLVKAAHSLGASPTFAFWTVYFPLSLPGFLAGALLVFVLSVGFYITPAILGGGRTIMISMLIERNVNLFFEWGAASSVAIVFLAVVLGIFWILNRFLAVERLMGE